jgi:hypothetical protein
MTFLNYVKAGRVFQLLSSWADAPEYITQCSIRPENKFTYKFNVTQQEEHYGGMLTNQLYVQPFMVLLSFNLVRVNFHFLNPTN